MRKRTKGRSGLAICLGLAAGLAAGPGLTAQAAVTGAAPAATAAAASGWHASEVYPVARGLGTFHSASPFAGFDALACTGPGDCLAAGSYQRLDGFSVRPMAATESGGAWTAAQRVFLPANPAGPGGLGQIDAISCPTRNWCAAGGELGGPAANQGFVITESGGTWNRPQLLRLPGNAGGSADVRGITCARRGSCLAVGWYSSGQTVGFGPMAVSLTGGRWGQATPIPVPSGGSNGELDSVACPSARLCVAVGEFTIGQTETADGMEAALSGGTWQPATAMQQPNFRARLSELDSVSCQSAVSCLAVGNDAEFGGLYTVFHDGRWQPSRYLTTAPGGGDLPRFTAVSCTARSCLAAGTYHLPDTNLTVPPFAITFSGGRWRDPVRLPLPRNAARPPVGSVIVTGAVSCVSSTSCTVMGLYDTAHIFSGWADTGPATPAP
jgi:hypothetical protein